MATTAKKNDQLQLFQNQLAVHGLSLLDVIHHNIKEKKSVLLLNKETKINRAPPHYNFFEAIDEQAKHLGQARK
jgi:hypothetical protein